MAMRVHPEFHASRHATLHAGCRPMAGDSMAGRFRHRALSLAIGALLSGSAGAYAGQPGQILPAGTIPQVRGVVYGQATVNAPLAIQGGNRLIIDQASQKAIIEWNSFDIARGSEVRFNQPNAGASALNRIFSLDPSVIQGKLTANGQIILINQNGILFDGGSQVNAHSLISSTLGLSDDVFKNRITANLDSSALQFDGVTGFTKIEVAGAATLTAQAGGNIILLAPNIVNNGIIQSPDGQVILAAGKSVLLFQPRDQNSSQMRGYFVQVTADAGPMNLTSLVTNLGTISADRGNVTLAGLAVNQMNRITAKSAVNRNGSIWLVAKDTAVLGAGSVTETPLDISDTTTLSESQDYTAFRASIKVTGNTVIDQGTIHSPSGSVMLATQQGAVFNFDSVHSSSVAITPGQTSSNSGPMRIALDQTSLIDTSGDWVDLSLSKNLVNVRITSNDLKDDPVQKGGALLGQTVTVDVRKGTPLFDLSGYAGAIQRSVAEKATTGGDISLLSQGELILQPGALLDVSGGGYRYAGGIVQTTKLLSGGRLYDIGVAPINLLYERGTGGTYQRLHPKWGVTSTYGTLLSQTGVYEQGYSQGKSAGSITLDGSSMIMNGLMRAGVTAGPQQTSAATIPAAGRLTIGIADSTRANLFLLNDITFVNQPVMLSSGFNVVSDALPQDRMGALLLPVGSVFKVGLGSGDRYIQDGFGSLTAGSNRQIELPAGITVLTPAGGSVSLTSSSVLIGGSIDSPGGGVSIKATGTGSNGSRAPTFEMLAGGQVSTAGLWVNDRVNPGFGGGQQAFPHVIDGGSVSLASDFSLILDEGSLIDVSAGANRRVSGSITNGKGGNIKLVAGSSAAGIFDGHLSLGGVLRGYSAGTGGGLDITAPKILIGAAAPDAQTLSISPDLFRSGGFTSYKLTGYYNTALADGTEIDLVADSFVIDPTLASIRPSGGGLGALTNLTRLPVWQRPATSLGLIASSDQQPGGGLLIGKGSKITTDSGASVTLTSRSALDVYGTIHTPAGSIAITQNSDLPNPAPVHIGNGAALLAEGYFIPQPTRFGLVQGGVMRGGTITLTSAGSVSVDAGSRLDVSGTSMAVSGPGAGTSVSAFETATINGDAGLVAITATGKADVFGELRGSAAQGAAGGTFTLDMKGGNNAGSPPRRLVVTQTGAVSPVLGTIDGTVAADVLTQGGFDKLRLSSTDLIEFNGNLSLAALRSIELGAPVFKVNADHVKISSTHVRLDGPSTDPANPLTLVSHSTSRGSGLFEVSAGLIDLVGGITINGVSQVSLNSSGDIRASGISSRLAAVVSSDQAGIPDGLRGYLVTPGSLSLSARQVYPTTLSQFQFSVADVAQSVTGLITTPVAGGRIDIGRAAGNPQAVFSAGGSVALNADTIDIKGSVAAPLGSVRLDGNSAVILEAGSLILVSSNGLVTPFGATVNGQTWTYAGIQNVSLSAKNISLKAPNVSIKDGAVLDVSGGGDIQAVEWVPGIGGSKDVLLAANTYAILPAQRLDYTPFDADLRARKTLAFNTDAGIYDMVYLSGGNGIAAGYYPLLPGNYALLPGAYKITPQTGSALANIQPGKVLSLPDGTPVLAGKYSVAGTGIQAQTWSAFAVENASQVRREAEYTVSNSSFFAAQAASNNLAVPPLPRDAGRVSISATNGLTFAPVLLGAAASGGNGAQVDIAAPDITVVSGSGLNGGVAGLQIDADKLSALNASLLLGGTRTDISSGTTLSVGAGSVTIAAGADLHGPEIILAATGAIDVRGGAAIRGQGIFSGTAKDIQVTDANSNGALLRVSSGNQVIVTRTGTVDRNQGSLTVESGAQVSATRSLILDSTKSTQSFGSLAVADGGFVSLGAGNISIGNAPASSGSLLIGTAELAGFSRLDTIALRSYTSIDFYGDITLGSEAFNRIALDAAAINGIGSANATVRARNLTLQNTSGNNSTASTGTGSIGIAADSVTLASGSKAMSGFATVMISANRDIMGAGTGDLRAAGALTLVSSRVTGAQNSSQAIVAVDDSEAAKSYYAVTLQPAAAPLADSGTAALGAKLAITGSSIDHSGDIELAAGSLTLTAIGAGGITLRDGSRIFAGAAAKAFGPSTAFALGGTIALFAIQGNVVSTVGSTMDLSGTASGGDAGTFALTNSGAGATVQLDGVLSATAASGYRQGSALLDLTSAQNFSALNARLNQGGFGELRNIRVRSGDVKIAGDNPFTQRPGDVVIANHFKLSADQGSITVGGTIDASSVSGGGTIELNAMNDLNLASGSFLVARGTSATSGASDAYSHGGSMELASRTGILTMASGAVIDVSAKANGKSNGGKVVLSARRTTDSAGADADVAMNLAGTINVGAGANGGQSGSVTVEGVHGYDGVTDTAIASNSGSAAMMDYQSFVGNSQSILARLTVQGLNWQGGAAAPAIHVSGGIELRSTGDMVMSSAWDLTSPDWMPSADPGRLTLRAAGTVTVQNTLGFPDDNLATSASWSIRLAGGADLQGADLMVVSPAYSPGLTGNVVFKNLSTFSYLNPRTSVGSWSANAAKVRTGTGDIEISAGRDIVIEGAPTLATDGRLIDVKNMNIAPKVAIYTAGLPVFDGAPDSLYPTGGGNISITAGRNITGTSGQREYVNDWLRRTSASSQGDIEVNAAGWWAARDTFRDDVGTLGGGNISFSAGADITNVSAVAPTFGRVYSDPSGNPAIDVQGGGNLDLRAGGNFNGGEYLVGRGLARFTVGSAIGQTTAPALYLMGQSTDPVLRGASFRVIAGGDINIQNVSNPTILVSSSIPGKGDEPGFERFRASFFTYDESSSVDLLSIAGNLAFPGQQATRVSKQALSPNIDNQWSDFLPPHITAVALQGGITGDHIQPSALPLRLYPSATSSLVLLGENSITNVAVEAADLNPVAQPRWGWNSAFEVFLERAVPSDTITFGPTVVNRLVSPNPVGGYDFVVASSSADVADSVFNFTRQSWISAGKDLRDVRLDLQNLSTGDVSVVRAGRDIRYIPQYSSGLLDRTNQGGYVRVGGPGRLLVQAGRNIDLGTSEGITGGGNNFNTSLPSSSSAALTIMAGVNGNITTDTIDQLFADLKVAGLAQNAALGEVAIQKVFNGSNTAPGNITMFFSAIKTQGGSGIDLLVPGGNINAGLPTPGGGNIGVFTTFGGGIRTYLSGDFNVNQSKVATLDGGDILLYSSNGNIDAGRGARDSVTTQPPQRVAILDDKGNPTGLFTFIPPSDATGSGIRSLTFDPDGPGPLAAPKPGDIFLFAPKGFIDAGEAGVSSAGNIFVAALQVLNANNFSAAGSSAGVPVAVNTGISNAAAGAGNVGASAAKSADEVTKNLASSTAANSPKEVIRPSVITVELLGIGEEKSREEAREK